jgi:23S rRNA (adenine2503-C2)-methyltransferase
LEIIGATLEELEEFIISFGQPRYRAQQIMEWLYQKGVTDFKEMTNLPENFRKELRRAGLSSSVLSIEGAREAKDGTKKYLFRLQDGMNIEAVYIPEEKRKTVCFSTQVGCAIGCAFCATGQKGFHRNLTAGEIVDQVRRIGSDRKTRISNAVAMGQGEPLANYDETLRAIKLLNADYGLGIAARHLTISTSGVVPAIYRLAEEELQINLALSLHAAQDGLRSELIPLNRTYPLATLMKSCKSYTQKTNRRITLEYIMIKGVNDGQEDLKSLSDLAGGWLCHVNLIPYNPVPDLPYQASGDQTLQHFLNTLRSKGVAASIRQERGAEVKAACGQLSSQFSSLA